MTKYLSFKLLLVLILVNSNNSIAQINIESGVFTLKCGERFVSVDYRISSNNKQASANKFALLLNGSPGDEFFAEVGDNYELLQETLIWSGYKVIELRYTLTPGQSMYEDAEGFYSACLHQGMNNVTKHSADLYDLVINKLGFDPDNPDHRLVGLGFSLGAVQLQSMAFTHGRKFNDIVLTGVLVGDVVKGCLMGLKYLERMAFWAHSEEDICSEAIFSEGYSWASFIDLAQQLTTTGQGCCSEEDSYFFTCPDGAKSEYTDDLNFENQPFFNTSNLTIFEGNIACRTELPNEFIAANPAQAKHIAEKRLAVGAPTKTYFFEKCSHEIVNCGGNEVLEMMLKALAPEVI